MIGIRVSRWKMKVSQMIMKRERRGKVFIIKRKEFLKKIKQKKQERKKERENKFAVEKRGIYVPFFIFITSCCGVILYYMINKLLYDHFQRISPSTAPDNFLFGPVFTCFFLNRYIPETIFFLFLFLSVVHN